MSRKHVTITLSLFAAAGLLVGCSSSEEGFPTGQYKSVANINGAGPVYVTFAADGTQTIEQAGTVVAGTYTVDGDQITLSDPNCKESGQETATYTWTWDASTLAMTTTKDDCGPRPPTVAAMTRAE